MVNKKYWVICKPSKGKPLNEMNIFSICEKRSESIDYFMGIGNFTYCWNTYYSRGYRCVKIKVTEA